MQVTGTDAGAPIRGATHAEVGGGDAGNGPGQPADGDAGVEEERLVLLLRDRVREAGKMQTAESLGVSVRTLDRAVDTGVLLPRIRDALPRRVLEEGGEEGLRHRTRVEALGRRTSTRTS